MPLKKSTSRGTNTSVQSPWPRRPKSPLHSKQTRYADCVLGASARLVWTAAGCRERHVRSAALNLTTVVVGYQIVKSADPADCICMSCVCTVAALALLLLIIRRHCTAQPMHSSAWSSLSARLTSPSCTRAGAAY
jgi:hypothetical protein